MANSMFHVLQFCRFFDEDSTVALNTMTDVQVIYFASDVNQTLRIVSR